MFEVGQIFTNEYPVEAALWCNQNKCYIDVCENGYIIKAIEHIYTRADYDNAIENHITATRFTRGYTVREPSSYINSSNARWAQDAQDWIAFVDEVMEYGLTALNAQTAPSFEDFKNNLPTITWSEVSDENTGGNSE